MIKSRSKGVAAPTFDKAEPPSPVARGEVFQVLLLGLVCALPPLAIDMALPATAGIVATFDDAAAKTGLTLSMFILGFGAAPLAYGFISDRIGRKAPMLVGIVLFSLGSLLCAVAPSLDALLAARVVQGAGAAAGPTLAYAISRDRLQGPALHRRLSLLTMILGVAPVIAPSLGALVLDHGDWRAVYAVLAGAGFLLVAHVGLGLRDSAPPKAKGGQAADSRRPDRQTIAYAAIRGLSGGSMFAYISGSPFLLIQTFGVSYRVFGWLFALTAAGIVVGSAASGRLAKGGRVRMVVRLGTSLAFVGPVVAGVGLWTGWGGLVTPMAGFATATLGYGMIMPSASHAALSRAPASAGMVSAAMNSFQMACMAASSALVAAALAPIGASALTVVMMVFALGSLLVTPWLAVVD